MSRPSRTAIVTLAIGGEYGRLWRSCCKANWEVYAKRHGYDVICVEEPFDRSSRARGRSPAWQKLLVLGQPFAESYERIVWVDSDVVINPAAPPIADGLAPDRVGAVDEYATPSTMLYGQALRKLYRHWEATGVSFHRNESAAEFYGAYGLPARHANVVQTGVLVLSPRHHRGLLERVYHDYEGKEGDLWGEWRPLSYELLEADAVEWLDHRFNYPWSVYQALNCPFLLKHPDHPRARAAATAALRDVHFLHFSGTHRDMRLVQQERIVPARARRRDTQSGATRVETPVALFVYARPETTRKVLDAVREARPSRLLVIGDSPPADRLDLAEAAASVRRLIAEVDWDCDVLTNYADGHMGLSDRVATGLDWVFDQVAEAIVLEDDCVPDPTFFRFCEDLLARYRGDARVTTISGTTFDFTPDTDGPSYRYSRYPLIWGWATWRRAWRGSTTRIGQWPELRDSRWLETLFDDPHAVAYWSSLFDQTQRGEGSWDYGWTLSSWICDGLAVVPRVNLVTNVGFGAGATNTNGDLLSPYANLPTTPMRFPLAHPERVEADAGADRLLEETVWSGNVRRMFARLRAARGTRAPSPL